MAGSESPKQDKSPKNNPSAVDSELEQKQLNGTIKQTSECINLDSNFNTLNEGYKTDHGAPQRVMEEKRDEPKKIKTPSHERR